MCVSRPTAPDHRVNSSPPSSFLVVSPVLWPYEQTDVRVVTNRPPSSSLEAVSPALMPWEMACRGKEPLGIGFGGSVVRLETLRPYERKYVRVKTNSPRSSCLEAVSPALMPWERACNGKEPPGIGFGCSVVRLEALRPYERTYVRVKTNSPRSSCLEAVSPALMPWKVPWACRGEEPPSIRFGGSVVRLEDLRTNPCGCHGQ